MNKFYTLPNGTRLLAKNVTRVGFKFGYDTEHEPEIIGVIVYSITGNTVYADELLCGSEIRAKSLLGRIVQELEAIHKDRL